MNRIDHVDIVLTRPTYENLAIVRVRTSDGITGLGCATFTQRITAVREVLDTYLCPLLVGRDPDQISELWRLMDINGYWRGGPILRNAISGVDQALWDIKGKRAGMPVYDLIGGKVRAGAAVYQHVAGRDGAELVNRARKKLATGVRHLRVQVAADPSAGRLEAATAGYGGAGINATIEGGNPGAYYDPSDYRRVVRAALDHLRAELPAGVELIHDVHSRLDPTEALAFARELEPYALYFLEDPLPPEHWDRWPQLRAGTTTPLAVGELMTDRQQWLPLVTGGHLDFLRLHVSAVGGFTPALSAAALCEAHGVRLAFHGPKDTSPLGHTAQLHLDLASYAFGVQEFANFTDAEREVFPGLPELRGGFLHANDRPGWGVDFDEAAARRHPIKTETIRWTQARRPDGSLHYP